MSIFVDLALRCGRWLFKKHFRVSRLMYVLIGAAGVLVILSAQGNSIIALAGLFGVALGVQGLVRWSFTSRPAPVLAVSVFASADREKALEVQRTIMTTLEDHLGRGFPLRIIAIPETVGSAESRFASVLRRRLRSTVSVVWRHPPLRVCGGGSLPAGDATLARSNQAC